MENLLGDRNTYRVLTKDPMLQFKDELHSFIERGIHVGVLNKKEENYLEPLFCSTPIVYFLPKIHKDCVNPPGKPIINGIDSVSSKLGQYIDIFLQPMLVKTEAFLKDTKYIIQVIETLKASLSSFLITADVSCFILSAMGFLFIWNIRN